MRNKWVLALACIFVLSTACALAQAAAEKYEIIPFSAPAVKAAPAAASAVRTSSTEPLVRLNNVEVYGLVVGGNGALSAGPSFKTNGIYALEVRVTWRRIPDGLHMLQLRYISPEGTVYETTTTPFITRYRPTRGATLATYIKDVSHPVVVQSATSRPGAGMEVWGELPTAGTWAQRLPGKWKVEILLDNQPTVYSTVEFTLTP